MDIIDAKGWNTLDRMKMLQKPMFIDEVGTTAVNYDGAYNYNTSLQVYATQTDAKNQRLLQLRDFLKSQPQILGANYFNVDLTNGLHAFTLNTQPFQHTILFFWGISAFTSPYRLPPPKCNYLRTS